MNLGQKIEQLLKTTSMTKVELSKRLGLKDSSVVSHWVKNRFKPDKKNLQKLSMVFEKPLNFFEDDVTTATQNYLIREGGADGKTLYDLISSLPTFKHVGVAMEIESEFFDLPYYIQPEEFLPITLESKEKDAFALKIASKLACPWAEKGEYALFLPSQSVQSGKLALIRYKNYYTIKKITKRQDKIILSSKAKQIIATEESIEIVARLLAFYRRS